LSQKKEKYEVYYGKNCGIGRKKKSPQQMKRRSRKKKDRKNKEKQLVKDHLRKKNPTNG